MTEYLHYYQERKEIKEPPVNISVLVSQDAHWVGLTTGDRRQVKKLGNIKDTLSMIPGLGAMAGPMDVDEREFARFEAIICSMTAEERAHPEIVEARRRSRVAKGSGTTPNDRGGVKKTFG